MKLIGIRDGIRTVVGRLFDDGTVAELAEAAQFYAELDRWLLEARSRTGGRRHRDELVEAPAVPAAARVLCVGLNYRLHAAEAGLPVPERPAFFGRWTASLVCGGTPVPVPLGEPGLDWEVELAAIVGRPLLRVDPGAAMAGVLGYAAFNDLSARQHQMHSRLWTVGKNADRSGPISPIVTADEVGDPRAGLRLQTRVNGDVVQDGDTADMIFSVGEILAYLSEVMTLNPGDVVTTGTPQGVGFKLTPPRFLVPGDVVEVEVERVGAVANPIE
ncbi:MAG TPA: fumarylacetoacetate hydrolase family protein [Dermatophilaceae bacterium]|nr:fumarylacetoacetate hydrolase family protein [Dermatophilaceae bacterium]